MIKDIILCISKKAKLLPMFVIVLVIAAAGAGCTFTGAKLEVSGNGVTPTEVSTSVSHLSTTPALPTSTVIPTATVPWPTVTPTPKGNNTVENIKQHSLIQKIYTQLTGNYYYKIKENKLFLSYDGKSYINTKIEIPQNMSTGFNQDNVFINKGVTAVVIPKNASADIYVSKDMCKSWTKTTLHSKEKDSYITVATYNPPTLSFSSAFIGFRSNSEGWIAFGGDVAMGNENNFVFQTTNGGKTWHEVRNSSNAYARVLTGACYTSSSTGFLCFRYDKTIHGPIYSTEDGGKTWRELPINYPSEYDEQGLTPASPRFIGKYGVIPMCSTDYVDYNSIVFYLYTNNGGKTWSDKIPNG